MEIGITGLMGYFEVGSKFQDDFIFKEMWNNPKVAMLPIPYSIIYLIIFPSSNLHYCLTLVQSVLYSKKLPFRFILIFYYMI